MPRIANCGNDGHDEIEDPSRANRSILTHIGS